MHHIMARGIDGHELFSDTADYDYFLSLLGVRKKGNRKITIKQYLYFIIFHNK